MAASSRFELEALPCTNNGNSFPCPLWSDIVPVEVFELSRGSLAEARASERSFILRIRPARGLRLAVIAAFDHRLTMYEEEGRGSTAKSEQIFVGHIREFELPCLCRQLSPVWFLLRMLTVSLRRVEIEFLKVKELVTVLPQDLWDDIEST